MHIRSNVAALVTVMVAGLALSSPAAAGGNIHIDTDGWVDSPFTLCNLGDPCSGTSLGMTVDGVNRLYIYAGGIVGFGAPLGGDLLHGLADITGGDYFAPSFGVTPKQMVLSTNAGSRSLRLVTYVDFTPSVFELFFGGAGPHFETVSFGYGRFEDCVAGLAGCGFAADGQAGYKLDGKTVDFGVGSLPFGFGLTLPLGAKAGVPEPSLWLTLLAGFGGLGVALRRSRKALRALGTQPA